jgi:hypothetical protein
MANQSKKGVGKSRTFREAVESIPALCFCEGLQALRASDRKHIYVKEPRCLAGSVDIDGCMKSRYPNDPRWDYAVGYQLINKKHEIVFWIEVHPAHDRAIGEVIKKREWLDQWLLGEGRALRGLEGRYLWVSTRGTQFTAQSPQRKQLAKSRILYVGFQVELHQYATE